MKKQLDEETGRARMNNCVHQSTMNRHGCRILKDEIVCDPQNCEWYCTSDQMIASFRKARQNYIKSHGVDEYFKQPRIVPAAFRFYGEKANDEA